MAGVVPAALWPAHALGKAQVRFVHALPGVGEGGLTVVRGAATQDVASARFAHVTHYTPVAPGSVELRLVPAGSEKAATTAHARLRDQGRYTVVAMPASARTATEVKLLVLRDGSARPGVALLRVVHAAPELGSPNLSLDGQTVAKKFPFGAVSPYLKVPPGRHDIAAMKTGAAMPLLKLDDLPFKAGTAATGVVVGTRGEQVRAVLAVDDVLPADQSKAQAPKARSADIKTPARRTAGDVHVVRRGECLWTIAEHRLGGDPSSAQIQRELVRIWNKNQAEIPSGDPNVIVPGQRLDLP